MKNRAITKKLLVWLLTLAITFSLFPMMALASVNTSDRRDLTITFRGNGGTPAITTRNVRYNSLLGNAAPDVSRDGFDFTGWWTESRYGDRWDENDRVTDSITLYAQWERIAGDRPTQPAPTPPALPPTPPPAVILPAPAPIAPPTAITPANIQTLTRAAVQAAAPDATPNVRLINPGIVPQEVLQAAVNAAQGRTITISASSLVANTNTTDVRIRFNPALATSDMNLAASTTSQSAVRTQRIFRNNFGGTMSVVSLGQQGDFDMEVRIAARIDTALDVNNLFFYAYNPATNIFRRFTPTGNTLLDDNGFLHFNTTFAGDIVISNTRI